MVPQLTTCKEAKPGPQFYILKTAYRGTLPCYRDRRFWRLSKEQESESGVEAAATRWVAGAVPPPAPPPRQPRGSRRQRRDQGKEAALRTCARSLEARERKPPPGPCSLDLGSLGSGNSGSHRTV
ncbi:hypothetical protein AAY473_037137 [Plecturocebus cupreus]